jgi:hypothetical protein
MDGTAPIAAVPAQAVPPSSLRPCLNWTYPTAPTWGHDGANGVFPLGADPYALASDKRTGTLFTSLPASNSVVEVSESSGAIVGS